MQHKEPLAYRLLNNSLQNQKPSQCTLLVGRMNAVMLELGLYYGAALLFGASELKEDEEVKKQLLAGYYPDFYYLDANEESLTTERVAELLYHLNQSALYSANGAKVYLIDNINNSSIKVYNQILKFIEETPNVNTYGILLSPNLNGLPATIISRCSLINCSYNERADLIAAYQKLGFCAEDSYYLSSFFNRFKEIAVQDHRFHMARNLLDTTLDNLENSAYLPYYLSYNFYPLFKDRNDLKVAATYFLKMLVTLAKDGLNNFGEEAYLQKAKQALRIYELAAKYEMRIQRPCEVKLLLDGMFAQLAMGRV